jgi:hypothetical protein
LKHIEISTTQEASREEGQPGLRRQPGWDSLFHLEGLFNPDGQQRGGLLWGLLRLVPGRDRGHPVLDDLAGAPFNTNPVLAGYLVAILYARLNAGNEELPAEEQRSAVERLRSLLAPVLSGLGDRIFWGGVRPVVTLLGILSAMLWVGEPALWVVLGYNAVAAYWRRRAWRIGLEGEEAVRREIRGKSLELAAERWGRAGRFLLGLALGVALAGIWSSHGWPGALTLVFLVVAGAVLSRGGRLSPLLLGWIGLALAGLLAGLRMIIGRSAI